MFLKVTLVFDVSRVMKSRKLTLHFISMYLILQRVGKVSYRVSLPPSLLNLHSVFHVSQLWKYISDMSHVIPFDHV